jgi:hypothetical protein
MTEKEMNTQTSSLIGMGKAVGGALAAKYQKTLRHGLERRADPEPYLQATANLLLWEFTPTEIPEPSGMKTEDLLARAEEAFVRVAGLYRSKGGVLLAKHYVGELALVGEMARQWAESFSEEVPTSVDLSKDLTKEEIETRLGLTAKADFLELMEAASLDSSNHLARRLLMESTGGVLQLPTSKLEGLCKRLALRMYQAFQEPNELAHLLVHGEEDELE